MLREDKGKQFFEEAFLIQGMTKSLPMKSTKVCFILTDEKLNVHFRDSIKIVVILVFFFIVRNLCEL